MNDIIITGNTTSSKNSKRIIRVNNSTRLLSSKQHLAWYKKAHKELEGHPLIGKQWKYPVKVEMFFVRSTRHRFDFNNLGQGPLDLLVDIGILEDDSMKHVIPVFTGWSVDKLNPRVIIHIKEE